MNQLSLSLFLATVALVVITWLLALLNARDLHPTTRRGVLLLGLVAGLLVPGLLASRGLLDRYSPLPAPALVLVAAITLLNIAIVRSPVGAALARHTSLAWLVGYQTFRIPVEFWLHRGFEEGVVPVQMTYAGRNFDVISGVTALALGLWLAYGRPPRGVVLAWNLLGLGLLLNIVTIAVLSTPVPFRMFANDPPNLLPSTYPYVWLPTFLVQAALMGHLLVFRALRSNRTPT